MPVFNNVLEAIGRTPLIRLNSIGKDLSSKIYLKAEFLNPGGSVKDRVGLKMIEAAEKEGRIRPGGTIIEATSGNTGVGLALVASVKGYKCIFVMPDKMSQEKISLLKSYGAEVVITPTAVPPDSPESYNGVADRLAKETPNSFRPDQFGNPENPLAHYLSTGPEIWEDSNGMVDVFVAGIGTGGTISGTAKYLKEKKPEIKVIGADPVGSILSGDSPKPYKVEGIGEDFIPKTYNHQLVDEMIRVSDKESFNTARRLGREEGMLVGGSSGTALAAAVKYAQRLTQPKFIVALMPDTGRNYINKIFSDQWMQENGLWEGKKSQPVNISEILAGKKKLPPLISVSSHDKLLHAVSLMQEYNISQLPVIDGKEIVGSLNEASMMQILHEGIDVENQTIAKIMGKPLPSLEEHTRISEAYRVLLSGASGILVKRENYPVGLITRSDLVNYWMHQKSEE
ncbi:MAG: cystathionine beta-synthase [Candidatus Wallbacteria bacterium]|nr:cystathionine beta-synthase [Candidatus Wallbacteria bacterium]